MGKPMPEELRAVLKAQHDPALVVACDHCEAAAGKRCRLRVSGRSLDAPHPSRVDKARLAGA